MPRATLPCNCCCRIHKRQGAISYCSTMRLRSLALVDPPDNFMIDSQASHHTSPVSVRSSTSSTQALTPLASRGWRIGELRRGMRGGDGDSSPLSARHSSSLSLTTSRSLAALGETRHSLIPTPRDSPSTRAEWRRALPRFDFATLGARDRDSDPSSPVHRRPPSRPPTLHRSRPTTPTLDPLSDETLRRIASTPPAKRPPLPPYTRLGSWHSSRTASRPGSRSSRSPGPPDLRSSPPSPGVWLGADLVHSPPPSRGPPRSASLSSLQSPRPLSSTSSRYLDWYAGGVDLRGVPGYMA